LFGIEKKPMVSKPLLIRVNWDNVFMGMSRQRNGGSGCKDWRLLLSKNHLSAAEESHVAHIEKHMVGFLFGEGDFGDLPSGFIPRGGG
jgi:Fe-S cluster biosynthesis and repair protein YggX